MVKITLGKSLSQNLRKEVEYLGRKILRHPDVILPIHFDESGEARVISYSPNYQFIIRSHLIWEHYGQDRTNII